MNPIVRVAQGQLQGVRETNINGTDFIAYRGIPYAKQPIGELRFKVKIYNSKKFIILKKKK